MILDGLQAVSKYEGLNLEPGHLALLEASSISPEVAVARGYRSIRSKSEAFRYGFGKAQQGSGLLLPMYSVIVPGPANYQLRRDEPRVVNGRIAKYETPGKSDLSLDCHPFLRTKVRDPSVLLFITEGLRKADAAVSRDLCCIAIAGVWNWRGRNERGGFTVLPDWEGVALKGDDGPRRVYIVFDSDIMRNPKVRSALERLKAFLESRGALVHVIYLPEGPNGEKTGFDDFFVRGGTVEELMSFATTELAKPDGDTQEEKTLGLVECSDILNARRLVAVHGQDLRYCPTFKKFLIWDNSRWRIDETGEADRRGKRILDVVFRRAFAGGVEEKDAIKLHGNTALRNVLRLAGTEPGVPVMPQDLDGDPYLLAVKNGVIDLRTGELREARREDLMTKQARVQWKDDAQCPRWGAFVREIMNGQEGLVRFLRRAIGYSLTGNCQERVFFVLWGRGRNGKSTLLEILRELLGDYAVKSPIESFLVKKYDGIPNDIARLRSARLVYAAESAEGRRLNEALVKDLTGREHISARFLYGEFFDFRPQFKLWIGTNHKPIIRGTDQAIWDRIRLIPFGVRFEGDAEDKDLPAKLREEIPGILRWAVEGCIEWQREGLGEPEEVMSATAEYRAEMDVLAEFLEACCLFSPLMRTNSTDLYRAFCRWCDENGEHPAGRKAFASLMQERGFSRGKNNRVFWQGIGLLQQPTGGTGVSGTVFQKVPPRGEGVPLPTATPPSGAVRLAEMQESNQAGHDTPNSRGVHRPPREPFLENPPAPSRPSREGADESEEITEWTA